MIDVHSHILPGIDDGAKTIQESKILLQEAKSVGFEAVITTPHYMEGYYEVEEKTRKELIKQLQKETTVQLYSRK